MNTRQSYENLNSVTFQQRLSQNMQPILLDVRTRDEFVDGRIPGAINIDVTGADFYERIEALDKSKTYFLYCRSGGRSGQACSIMSDMGFTVINLAGGLMNWNGKLI